MEEGEEEASVPCVYLPSGLLGQGAGDDEVKVSMKSVQPWRERTHPHKDLHVLPKSAVSMDTKSPAYRLGEPPAPLPLSSFTPFSHFPALPSSLLHICLPWGAPYSCIPISSLPLPPISLLVLVCTMGTLVCQPRARRPCLLRHNCQAAPVFCSTHLPTFS